MPWSHVLSEAAYGLMKAVSPVEDDIKKQKRSIFAGELLQEQTEKEAVTLPESQSV